MNTSKKVFHWLTPLVVLAMLIGACAPKPEPTATPKPIQPTKEAPTAVPPTEEPAPVSIYEGLEFYAVVPLVEHPYWVDEKNGLEDAGKELGITVHWTGTPEWDPAALAKFLEELAIKRPDGILLCPADAPTSKLAIDRVLEMGIPIITIDADSPDSNRLAYIGTDNYALGEFGAHRLAEMIGGKGKVAIMTNINLDNVATRARGYKETLEKYYPDIEVIKIADDKSDPQYATTQAAAIMQANPDLAAWACCDATAPTGVMRAVKDAGLEGKVKILAVDRDGPTLEAIQEGFVDASVVQKSYMFTYTGVKMLADLVVNTPNMGPGDWQTAALTPISRIVHPGVGLITKENVGSFVERPGPKTVPNNPYEGLEFYAVVPLVEHPYWVDEKNGLEDAGKELGITVHWTGTPEWDPAALAKFLEELAIKRPDGILLCPADAPTSKLAIDRVLEMGIPIITIDADSPDSNRLAYIGTDNYALGEFGAHRLAEMIGGKGKVAIMTNINLDNVATRARGYKETLEKYYPDIEVIKIADDKSDPQYATTQAAAIMQANPDLAAWACCDATAPTGVMRAVKDAGLEGKVKILAVDRDGPTLEAIQEGFVDASVVQKSYMFTYAGVKMLADLVVNTPNMAAGDWQTAAMTPISRIVHPGVGLITKENVEAFIR